MTAWRLLAITADAGPGLPGRFRLEHFDRFTAVFSQSGLLPRMTRRAALRAAATRQADLEELMHHGTVIPALSRGDLTPEATPAALRGNVTDLASLATRLAGLVQYQITVTAQPGTPTDTVAARIEAGLARAAHDWVPLPKPAETLCNAACLWPADTTDRLDAILNDIDMAWPGQLRIRQIGPSPAVSFASIWFDRVGACNLRLARDRLGLKGPVAHLDPRAIASARRTALMAGQPPDTIRRDADALSLAAALGADGAVHILRVWSEGRATL
ncbi:MAG: GvpL/GvpF family gas vesicle protein, partial [Pseudomonadota bacterium]